MCLNVLPALAIAGFTTLLLPAWIADAAPDPRADVIIYGDHVPSKFVSGGTISQSLHASLRHQARLGGPAHSACSGGRTRHS
jgi:hypothetical protein